MYHANIVKMSIIVGILTCMSMTNFMIISVEHNFFYNLGL